MDRLQPGRLDEARAAKQDGGAGTRRTSIIEIEYMLAVASSTPPEVVRVQPSLTMSMRGGKGELLVLQLPDASSGSSALRRVAGPRLRGSTPESYLNKDLGLIVERSTFGMRDAGPAFGFASWDHFLQNEFVQGMYFMCVYRHRVRTMKHLVRGDDYVGVGTRHDVD